MPACVTNYMPDNVCHEITYPFPNSSRCFIVDVIISSMLGLNSTRVSKKDSKFQQFRGLILNELNVY